jgi:hypothetical protein
LIGAKPAKLESSFSLAMTGFSLLLSHLLIVAFLAGINFCNQNEVALRYSASKFMKLACTAFKGRIQVACRA